MSSSQYFSGDKQAHYYATKSPDIIRVLSDVNGFPTWESASFACGILGSYEMLNARIKARNAEARAAVLRQTGVEGASGPPGYYDRGSFSTLGTPNIVVNQVTGALPPGSCFVVPILLKHEVPLYRRFMEKGSNRASYTKDVGFFHLFTTMSGLMFAQAIVASYALMADRHEKQYESELVPLSSPVGRIVGGKTTRKDAVDALILATLMLGLTH